MKATVTYTTRSVLDARRRQYGATDIEQLNERVAHPIFLAGAVWVAFHTDNVTFDASVDRFESVVVRDTDGTPFAYSRDELVERFPSYAAHIRAFLDEVAMQNDVRACEQKSWF